MNPLRILIVSNRYLLAVGFAVKIISKKYEVHRRSIWGTIVFLLFNVLYLMCLYEHYDKKSLLEIVKDFSKTIYYSLYTHLFIGMTCISVILFEWQAYSAYSNQVMDALPKNGEMRPKFDRVELFVYHRTFINLLVSIGLLIYDLTVIDLEYLTRSRAMLFIALYYPHCAIANCLRYFTIQMALLKNICQTLNKRISDIELAHEFRHHHLFLEYLKTEASAEEPDSESMYVSTWKRDERIATIDSKPKELNIQDSVYFQKWWSIVRYRNHSSRRTDVIRMLDAMDSDEFLLIKFKIIFAEYDQFMKLYRKLEALIQKQLFLIVCQHSIIVMVAVYMFVEVDLEWGDLLEDKMVMLVWINYSIHLVQIFHDFGCMVLSAIFCRNEIRNTKAITTKLMAMPFSDNVRCAVSYFYFKLQGFRENVYAFNLIEMDGCSYFMVRFPILMSVINHITLVFMSIVYNIMQIELRYCEIDIVTLRFVVILQYAVLAVIYTIYQYFAIKLESLQSTVDSMKEDDE